jgi:hypothetical protein
MEYKVFDRNPSGTMRVKLETHYTPHGAARSVALLNGHEKKNGRDGDRYYSEPDTSHVPLGSLNLPDWYYDAYRAKEGA